MLLGFLAEDYVGNAAKATKFIKVGLTRVGILQRMYTDKSPLFRPEALSLL